MVGLVICRHPKREPTVTAQTSQQNGEHSFKRCIHRYYQPSAIETSLKSRAVSAEHHKKPLH